ncbi:MAG: tripartite tricarboxylate transporter substrate binding protein [Betaproteobacteria bacterium]|nr:tripartite tricarboxylate transporter substrate binding protein [Betaproteobacteria bacterium]
MQARLLAKRFTETMGQPFVVDNRPGASGVIGADVVARAPADGYTLMIGTAQIAVSTLLLKKKPFDMLKDFAHVSLVSTAAQFMMLHPSVPARTVPQFVALAQKHPGQLNAGSSGTGSANHLALEMLKQAAAIDVAHVPYRSGAPSIAALIAGETALTFSGAVTALPHVRSGKVRALAVTSLKPVAAAPDTPTLASFYPGFESANWYAVFALGGTPTAIVNRLNGEIITALKAQDMRDFMRNEGAEAVGGSPAELEAYVRRELDRYAKVIARANIRIE